MNAADRQLLQRAFQLVNVARQDLNRACIALGTMSQGSIDLMPLVAVRRQSNALEQVLVELEKADTDGHLASRI